MVLNPFYPLKMQTSPDGGVIAPGGTGKEITRKGIKEIFFFFFPLLNFFYIKESTSFLTFYYEVTF